MSTQDQSMELLVNSYHVSSRRIREALDGALSIRNSRKPNFPPTGTDEVIGLCGQSGRHPYFRIPLAALTDALDRIDALMPSSRHNIQDAVDELNAVCQDLRQQTYFDAGTGCVNDQVPAVVPLLPPEEIWYTDRELPLDVWRLVSFEFDLVSSAIASQVPVMDIGQGVATQGALMLGHILNQLGNRMVQFSALPDTLHPTILAELDSSTPVHVSAARLFFEAGSLLTPLAPTDFTRWYAGVRYLNWLDQRHTEFRVRSMYSQPNVDSRYRGLFAEEMAIGLMAVVLTDRLGAVRINNTVEVLPPTYQGGQMIADFVAESVDSAGRNRVFIAESKGSLGSKVSTSRRTRAKQQVSNTSVSVPGIQTQLGLTFCSSMFFSNQSSITNCLVNDPKPREEGPFLDRSHAWRIAYAKTLRFAGLDAAARSVAHGEPVKRLGGEYDDGRREYRSDRERHLDWRRRACRKQYGAELLLDFGNYGLMMDSLVLDILRHGIHEEVPEKLAYPPHMRRRERPARGIETRSFLTGLGIGCVLYEELG
jgi:hypothetical protein